MGRELTDISDDEKLALIGLMDLSALASFPERAAIVGPNLAQGLRRPSRTSCRGALQRGWCAGLTRNRPSTGRGVSTTNDSLFRRHA